MPRLDLIGPDKNDYMIMETALQTAKQLHWSEEDIDKLKIKMMSGDYRNLVKTFIHHFGDYFEIVVDEERYGWLFKD